VRDELAVAAQAQKAKEFQGLMTRGRTALQAKRYREAVEAFEAALKLEPNDTTAAQALAEAKKGPPAAPPTQSKPPTPPAKPTAYVRQMETGASQEKANRYDLAFTAYKAALQALPNDADAKAKIEFCQAMVDGEKALKQRKFADARTAYETALKLFPNDANARAGLQHAKTGK